MANKRNRYKQTLSLDERLRQMARTAREAAARLPRGLERDELLRKARQAEMARGINDSLTMPEPVPSG